MTGSDSISGRGLTFAALIALAGCASSGGDTIRLPDNVSVDDLDIVDCSLPGQVRQLGSSMIYETPRRMVRTTRGECGLRGGEMLVYDRANPESAVQHWLVPAEAGDSDAQFYLGQIFEGRAGMPPDYERAAQWYRRAAEAGHRGAQASYAVLLEKGLGVEKDLVEALRWYREASGLEVAELRLSSETQAELDALRVDMEQKLERADRQIDSLQSRVGELQSQLDAAHAEDAAARQEAEDLGQVLDGLEAQREQLRSTLVALGPTAPASPEQRAEMGVAELRRFGEAELGRYYALVIGNRDYAELDELATSVADANRVSALLESRYGFSVTTLINADEIQIKRAINRLGEIVEPRDNVLIYFAGHGVLSEAGARMANSDKRGYWLPVNAEAERDTHWVDNWWITDHLARNKARRIVVVADSCYAGLFSTDTGVPLSGDLSLSRAEIDKRLPRRTRYVLSSGDVRPVAGREDGSHSRFARAFIDVLEANAGLLTTNEVYGKVFERLAGATGGTGLGRGLDSLPELRPIRPAGHEWGEFFFLPVR